MRMRLSGGAIYDALAAITAKQFDATLLTLDSRVIQTYQIVGVDFQSIV
jgi:predicted nucleic acid-binding protein